MSNERSVLDQLVRTGASWDWVTPVLHLTSGKHTIGVHESFQVPIEIVFKQENIRIFHAMIVGDEFLFQVDQTRKERAMRLISRMMKG